MPDVDAVVAERTAAYGSFRLNAFVTQWLLVITRGPAPLANAVVEEGCHMCCHKAARMIIGGQVGDSLVDMRGYLDRMMKEQTAERWEPYRGHLRKFELTVQPSDKLPRAVLTWIERFLTTLQAAVRTGKHDRFNAMMQEYLDG